MKKYFLILKLSWQKELAYRFNLILGRARNIIVLIILYYLWLNVGQSRMIAGFSVKELFLYVFLAAILKSFIMGAQTRQPAQEINDGTFSKFLTQPINTLFYALTRLTDVLDIIFLLPIIAMIIYIASQIPVITVINYLLYFAFILVSLIIITGIHILAAAASVYYVESENLIWAYREAMAMGRLPQEVFPAGIQLIFTFIMPIFLMITFPAKILLGILSFKAMIFMIVYAVIFLPFSLFVWNISLKHYSSASS